MHLSSLECKSEMLENEECSSSNSRNIDGFIGVVNFSSPSPFLFFLSSLSTFSYHSGLRMIKVLF
jgi:hypothetical protein